MSGLLTGEGEEGQKFGLYTHTPCRGWVDERRPARCRDGMGWLGMEYQKDRIDRGGRQQVLSLVSRQLSWR